MPRRVYLSFLGLGPYDKETDSYYYHKTVYELAKEKSAPTRFVQVAEMELLGGDQFDVVFIVATSKSKEIHFEKLSGQMQRFGGCPTCITIEEEMEPEDQWEWFELILENIEHGDLLTVDLTHGYRSVPIIFSAAINFLQKARAVRLNAVYYGAFDKNRKLAPIIDMKDFYLINEWADAVGRLVDDADARKLAVVAEKGPAFQAGDLNDESVIHTFEDLTDTIRNVDVNNLAKKANDAVALIRHKQQKSSRTGKLLLGLVIDKFTLLTTADPPSGEYDRAYFEVQIEIIRLLLEHKLFMQAYTVMREFIASVGMIEVPKAKVGNNEGRKRRLRFGELFVAMVQFDKDKWEFADRKQKDCCVMLKYYERLEDVGVMEILNGFAKELMDFRNGFDHAWTAKAGALSDIPEKGDEYLKNLEKALDLLVRNGFLKS